MSTGATRKLPDAQEILSRIPDGLNTQAIAVRLGRKKSQTANILKRSGWEGRMPPGQRGKTWFRPRN